MGATLVLGLGCLLVGGACLVSAGAQRRSGETWGGTGRGRIRRADAPGYFRYLFWMRMVLGTLSLAGGFTALIR
ncbi:MAG TPA: hypothetical protein VFN09_05405 [Rhodanobacteraceae bacterium]|nr:hypothetical protein [Rhodanobacteraceae bacterium]